MEAREAQLCILVLKEKRRIARAAYSALRRWGRHEDGCNTEDDEPCNCGFKKVKREWRLAAEGKD